MHAARPGDHPGRRGRNFRRRRAQAKQLAALKLFPAPAASRQRVLQVRELQDLLILQGVNLAEHRFSGSSQVTVGPSGEAAHKEADQPPSPQLAKRVQRRVREAVVQYLQAKTGTKQTFLLQFELPPALVRSAAVSSKPITISGGTAPWTDAQTFELSINAPEGQTRTTLDVQVGEPSLVVAAVHSLSRDDHPRKQRRPGASRGGRRRRQLRSLDRRSGRQANDPRLADGKILTADAVQAQLLVHRGDVVTVYARSAGITVRTTARARDDGSLGELVALETMQERKPYQARVCGVRETKVFAQAMTVEQK